MRPGRKAGEKIMAVLLAVLFILIQLPADTCSADQAQEEPQTLIVRPELLPEAFLAGNKILAPTRNPFIWPAGQKAIFDHLDGSPRPDPFAELDLNGIIWVRDTPVVIINNRQLRKGDTIDGIKVREITRDSVVLATKKTRRTLRFPSSEIDFSTPPAEVE